MLIKHEAKPSALLVLRPSVKYFHLFRVKYEQGNALIILKNFPDRETL